MFFLLLATGICSLAPLSADPINYIEFDDCVVSFFEDDAKNKLVLKQMKDPSNNEQFLLVIDATACHIAEKIQIPMNRVTLIAANTPFPHKINPRFPATIHTLAPGIRTDQNNLYQNIDIQQRFRERNSPMERKWGILPPENTGLTLLVIQEMAKHPALPKIVALDTFLGNADRSPPNLFYDALTDQFCGIDMAGSFNSDLAKEACRQIQTFIDENITLTSQEKNSLAEYANTLENLIAASPPRKQEIILYKFAREAGFTELDQEISERIDYHKRYMERNYSYSKELLCLIDKLLTHQTIEPH